MPTKSSFPDVEIPDVDLWTFVFNGEKDFGDDQGGTARFPKQSHGEG